MDCFDSFDFEEEKGEKQILVKSFKPFIQEPLWFFDDTSHLNNSFSHWDVDLYKAFALYDNQKYSEALEIFENLLQTEKHNRVHKFMLVDSILRCMARQGLLDQCKSYLEQLDSLVVDHGEQIQYLRVKSEVSKGQQFVDTVSLLCTMTSLPEHWLLFQKAESKNPLAVKVCSLAKCIHLLELSHGHSAGFVQDNIRKKIDKLKSELDQVDVEPDLKHSLMEKMKSRMENKPVGTSSEPTVFKAHDCRVKNLLVDGPSQAEIIAKFRDTYSCMFDFLLL